MNLFTKRTHNIITATKTTRDSVTVRKKQRGAGVHRKAITTRTTIGKPLRDRAESTVPTCPAPSPTSDHFRY